MEEETLEGAGHSQEQSRTSSSQRTTGAGIIQTIPCFLPIFSHLLWSPFPHTQTNCRAMVLLEFYLHSVQVLSPGDQPVEPSPCSLLPAPAQATCTSKLKLQEGHTSSTVSTLPHSSESSRGFIGTRSSTPPQLQGGQVKPFFFRTK